MRIIPQLLYVLILRLLDKNSVTSLMDVDGVMGIHRVTIDTVDIYAVYPCGRQVDRVRLYLTGIHRNAYHLLCPASREEKQDNDAEKYRNGNTL